MKRIPCEHDDKYAYGIMKAGVYTTDDTFVPEWRCLLCDGKSIQEADNFVAKVTEVTNRLYPSHP